MISGVGLSQLKMEGESMSGTIQHKEANAGPLGLLGFGMTTILFKMATIAGIKNCIEPNTT